MLQPGGLARRGQRPREPGQQRRGESSRSSAGGDGPGLLLLRDAVGSASNEGAVLLTWGEASAPARLRSSSAERPVRSRHATDTCRRTCCHSTGRLRAVQQSRRAGRPLRCRPPARTRESRESSEVSSASSSLSRCLITLPHGGGEVEVVLVRLLALSPSSLHHGAASIEPAKYFAHRLRAPATALGPRLPPELARISDTDHLSSPSASRPSVFTTAARWLFAAGDDRGSCASADSTARSTLRPSGLCGISGESRSKAASVVTSRDAGSSVHPRLEGRLLQQTGHASRAREATSPPRAGRLQTDRVERVGGRQFLRGEPGSPATCVGRVQPRHVLRERLRPQLVGTSLCSTTQPSSVRSSVNVVRNRSRIWRSVRRSMSPTSSSPRWVTQTSQHRSLAVNCARYCRNDASGVQALAILAREEQAQLVEQDHRPVQVVLTQRGPQRAPGPPPAIAASPAGTACA